MPKSKRKKVGGGGGGAAGPEKGLLQHFLHACGFKVKRPLKEERKTIPPFYTAAGKVTKDALKIEVPDYGEVDVVVHLSAGVTPKQQIEASAQARYVRTRERHIDLSGQTEPESHVCPGEDTLEWLEFRDSPTGDGSLCAKTAYTLVLLHTAKGRCSAQLQEDLYALKLYFDANPEAARQLSSLYERFAAKKAKAFENRALLHYSEAVWVPIVVESACISAGAAVYQEARAWSPGGGVSPGLSDASPKA